MATDIKHWTKLLAAAATDASFPARVATVTAPAGGIDVSSLGSAPDSLELLFFGTAAADLTYAARVIGWRKASATLWIPEPIATVAVTLGTAVGVAGEAVANTDYLADTITLTSGIAVVNSPADNTAATIIVGLEGFAMFEVIFDMTGAASGNALYAAY